MKRPSPRPFLVFLYALLLASCGGPSTPTPPTIAVLPTDTVPLSTDIPTAASPAPTDASMKPVPTILPAPLYFLSTRSGSAQVWRVDADGETVHQITDLPGDVTAFDVSPIDGALAYVYDGALWWAEANGANARQRVAAPDLSQYAGTLWQDADWFNVDNPRWSPDGTRVAYSRNGVWTLSVADGATALLQANHLPQPPEPEVEIKNFSPVSWSPDGRDLLIAMGLWEGAVYALLDATRAGEPRPLSSGSSVAWTPDSSGILIGGSMYGSVGLKGVDRAALTEEIWCQPDDCLVQFPYIYPDGHVAFVSGDVWAGTPPRLAIGQWTNGQFSYQEIRAEPLMPQTAVWSPDGAWLAVVGMQEPDWRALNRAPQPPQLVLVPAGRGDKIMLSPTGALVPAFGVEEWQPRWGANVPFTPRPLATGEKRLQAAYIPPMPAPWQPNMGAQPVLEIAVQGEYVWAGWPASPLNGGGLVRWIPAENRYDNFSDAPLVASGVWALAVAPDGALWVGTDHGAARYDGANWQTFTTVDGLVSNHVEALAVAPDGTVWIGTWQGLSRYRAGAWQTFTTTNVDGLGADFITALSVSPDGTLWVGTYGGGVSRGAARCAPTNDTWQTFTVADDLVSDVITALDAASGTVWVAGHGGISQYSNGAWQSWTAEHLRFAQLSAIELVPGRGLWVATCLNGVYLFDGQAWQTFTEANGLATDCVNDIAVDAQGSIWFAAQGGTIGGGLSRYDGQTWQTFVTK